jgi:hypothetical protein
MRFASCLPLAITASVALLGLFSPGLGGCSSSSSSSSGGTSGCVDYSPPSDFVATAPVVSFSKDVIPIFQQSCAFSTCHGSTTGPSNGVFLGNDAPRVYTNLVGKAGDENPMIPFITASDPRTSYLMRKMDASQCAVDSECTGGSCQSSMPKGDDSLPVATRDIVRRWIAQGAQNN